MCVSLSVVSEFFTTLWTLAHQAPLFMEFPRSRILEWVAIPFSGGIFLIQGLNSDLLYCRQILYCLTHDGS